MLGEPLVDGQVRISTVAPTATVTVTSDKGGSATAPVVARGAGMQADKPVAAAFANPMDAAPGQRVTLTGTGSTGTISTWTWRQVPATVTEDVEVTLPDGTTGTQPSTVEVPVTDANRVTLAGADTSVATFNAPAGYRGTARLRAGGLRSGRDQRAGGRDGHRRGTRPDAAGPDADGRRRRGPDGTTRGRRSRWTAHAAHWWTPTRGRRSAARR